MKWMVWLVVALGAVGLAVVLGTYMGPAAPAARAPEADDPAASAARVPEATPQRPGRRLAPMNPESVTASMPERLGRLNLPRVGAPVANLGDPAVQASLLAAREDVKACHAAAAAHDPSVPRATTLTLHLGPPSGGMSEVQSVESSVGGEFDACATRVFARFQVPANDAMTTHVPMAF